MSQGATPDEMIRMRRAGFLLREIADKAGPPWTASRVCHFLNKLDVKPDEKPYWPRKNKITHDYPRWLIHEMYWGCELSKTEIAYELDITLGGLNRVFDRLDVPTRTDAQARAISVKRYPHSASRRLTEEDMRRGVVISARKRKQRTAKREYKRQWRDRCRAEVMVA